jgi:acetyl-CoA synthetase
LLHFILIPFLFTSGYDQPAPLWTPDVHDMRESNIATAMHELGFSSYNEFYQWSIKDREAYWTDAINKRVHIAFKEAPRAIFEAAPEAEGGMKSVRYLPGARMNIADSCFPSSRHGSGQRGQDEPAIVFASESAPRTLHHWSFGHLEALTNKVAHALTNKLGLKVGDAMGICMPMTPESVAIYLGIVKAGLAVVSIADSFSATEIATRVRLSGAKGIFTQDVIYRGDKALPLFDRVVEAEVPLIVVLPGAENGTIHQSIKLRAGADHAWSELLDGASDKFESVFVDPDHICNVLFSSGTTGEPKPIPWFHSTPVKCAVDAYYHTDVRPGEVVAWPTNIGWMMGPWLIYQLINRATLALYVGVSTTAGFCQFIEAAKVNMLGVVPSIVKAWQLNDHTVGCDWSTIRRFASTGETSSADAMLWLSSRAGYKPIIEYCGGTEIGGAYITSTMVHPNVASSFTTATLGLRFMLIDDQGAEKDTGEVALLPPSLGLSTRLLNRDHHKVYYDDMPTGPAGELLRRHGDEIERLSPLCLRALGRCDDTMNLGGIKVSSIELERVCNKCNHVSETAAVAVNPASGHGPSVLVVFVVPSSEADLVAAHGDLVKAAAALQKEMQNSIKKYLNPLFGISHTVIVNSLPRTASNKIMRRVLRDQFIKDRAAAAAAASQ